MTSPAAALPVTFLVASPHGDLPYAPELAGVPLEGCPLQTTYGEYFAGLRDFCMGPGQAALFEAAGRAAGRPVAATEVTELVIKAQKHGALYHPASIEVRFPGGQATLGANVAASPHGWAALAREHTVLDRLSREVPEAGLPRPLCFDEGDRLDILLVEWFAGFHEFHAATGGGIVVWDFEGGGIAPLGPERAGEAYRQAARILALCLEVESGARIWPWRHAAGDFVVRRDESGLETRLITARGYGPSALGGGERGLLHFFLTTTLFMRLDRLDGVGARAFLPGWCLAAAVEGMLDALGQRPGIQKHIPDFAAALRRVTPDDWRSLLTTDADFCSDPDAPFLMEHLSGHLVELFDILSR
ncbi:hypothetical protein G3N56_11460 [Desulfovibrio sulfodismutans]|uniref:Uncharacterized protein n=1 Tax=Desulfolutivibrio sulfodismutans TaxID=63561 RepID=A0A7K3NMG5_9BACT|nr:hypothetical protein [Desulfolutivibrio sulfodismutans]NDY57358.1 hypothetical protein [Desulfolutivibrio sulfodismutans]QLA12461.1 hypothetical protein GD606_09315 [Desulfolutivibrio sulfodismutans DSM 3696]